MRATSHSRGRTTPHPDLEFRAGGRPRGASRGALRRGRDVERARAPWPPCRLPSRRVELGEPAGAADPGAAVRAGLDGAVEGRGGASVLLGSRTTRRSTTRTRSGASSARRASTFPSFSCAGARSGRSRRRDERASSSHRPVRAGGVAVDAAARRGTAEARRPRLLRPRPGARARRARRGRDGEVPAARDALPQPSDRLLAPRTWDRPGCRAISARCSRSPGGAASRSS